MLNINKNKPYKLTKHGYSKRKTHPMIYQLAQDYDSFGYISNHTAKELEKLFDEDYEILIHRTGFTKITDNIINDVFNNGLKNNGDTMQGVGSNYTNERTKTLSQISDLMLMIGSIKTACNYKESDGVFIVKIPKSYIDRNYPGEAKPIYYVDGYEQRLLPEFIYGYVPVKDLKVGNIIKNPRYRDYHDYAHDGLVYEPDVEPNKKAM